MSQIITDFCTSVRLSSTEHFHNLGLNMRGLTPSHSGTGLWKSVLKNPGIAKGISSGEQVKVSSKRGLIRAVAVVTPRLQETRWVDGKPVENVAGIPIHWGFRGRCPKGFISNTLTPGKSVTPTRKRLSLKRS
ncbi:hypothetical protein ACNKHW_10755 [Shigella flexneri]